jgi:hypothetical protein
MASASASASAFSSEKVWQQYILDDSDVENVDELKGLWIYCQVCAKKINMKHPSRGSRWNEHAKAVSHLEANKAKQEHQKAGELPITSETIVHDEFYGTWMFFKL